MDVEVDRMSPLRGTISQEIASLLREGCVLRTPDVREIADKLGYAPRINILPYFGLGAGSNRFQIAGLPVIQEKVLSCLTIRSAELPIEETEFERVAEEIHKMRQRATFKGHSNRRKKLGLP